MPDSSWKLLAMYLYWVDYELLRRDEPQVTQSKLVGAIVSNFLHQHEGEIRDAFYRIETELLLTGAPAEYFTPAQLAACDAARGAEATEHTRRNWRGMRARNAARARAKEGFVRLPNCRSARPIPWAPRRTRELRQRSERALAALSLRKETTGGTNSNGDTDAG